MRFDSGVTKRIGLLSFGQWMPSPHSQASSGLDVLLQCRRSSGPGADLEDQPWVFKTSTVKALVADLVPATRRATAYGAFAAVQGAAAALGGAMAGALYEHSLPALTAAVSATQLIALVLLVTALRRHNGQQALLS
jgi:hypothetical protein